MIFALDRDLEESFASSFRNHQSESIPISNQIKILKDIEIMHKNNNFLDLMSKMTRFRQRIGNVLKRLNQFVCLVMSLYPPLFLIIRKSIT